MGDSHAASPNSEVSGRVTPGSQNATSTVPTQLSRLGNGATETPVGAESEATKIVKTSPGV
jgi:hypothetical protein